MKLRNFFFTVFASSCLLMTAIPALAVDTKPYSSGAPTEHELIVPIGTGADRITKNNIPPGTYINAVYKWGIGLAALLAMGQLVLGGVLYTLSAGSLANREAATEKMKNSVTGLILLVAGATILITINPKLVNLKPLDSQGKVQNDLAALDKYTVDPALLAAAESAGPSPEAALAAKKRLNVVPGSAAGDCETAAGKMKEEIYEFAVKRSITGLDKDDPDIHEVTDDVGTSQGSADFLEYMVKARDAANIYQKHCYQDAVIHALGYAKLRMSLEEFAMVVDAFKKDPFTADLEATKYLASDPFSRTAITPQQTLDEINTIQKQAVAAGTFRDTIKEYEQDSFNQKIDAKPPKLTEAATQIAKSIDSSITYHSDRWVLFLPSYLDIIAYAKPPKLAEADYEKFKASLTSILTDKTPQQVFSTQERGKKNGYDIVHDLFP